MSHMKNLRMFQLSDVPPKLDSWQDYFAQIKQGAGFFAVFLHYYEPVLNEIANSFCRKYGLDKHFDDLADLYQYTAADSVMKLYHRALRKLRSKLGTKE